MKILQINKFFYRRGGADYHFLDLKKILEDKGEDVICFSMKDERNEESKFSKYFVSNVSFGKNKGIVNFFKRFRTFYSFEAVRKLNKLIKDEKPDIAHVHLIYNQIPTSILKVLKKYNIPVVATIHDWKMVCPNYSLKASEQDKNEDVTKYCCTTDHSINGIAMNVEAYWTKVNKYYKQYVDQYIAPSNFVKDVLINTFQWNRKQIIVLPHFLSPNIEIEKNKKTDNICFAYAGRLLTEKGIDKLVEYWYDHGIVNDLNVYGDGPLRKKIEEYINDNDIENVILHGRIDHDKLQKELKNNLAVIVPSIVCETFGLVAIEAFASSIPVIVNDLGPLPELVEKSGGGEIFSWSDDESLEQALNKVIETDYTQSIFKYIQNNHTVNQYYNDIMKIYSVVCKNKK